MTARSPSQWTVFAIVAVGVLMATIDSSIVNVSLPVIAAYFHQPLGGAVEWVVIAYLVVVASLLLTAGRLADVVGRNATWAAGLVVFTAGSVLCGTAQSLGWLVAFRALQGLGSAATMAVSPAMLVSAFPPQQRGKALGLNAVVVGVGVSLGPTLGGIITQHLGWRWIFYVNVPLGALGVLASLRFLPRHVPAARQRVDVAGAVLLAAGLGALTGGLSFGPDVGWTSGPVVASGIVAALALSGLVVRVRTTASPLIDPALFSSRVFTSASVSLLLSFVATFSLVFLLPFYLEQVRGFSAQRTGLLLTPLPLTTALIAPGAGSLADRIGTRLLAAGGMFVTAAGIAMLAFSGMTTTVPSLVTMLVVLGVGRAAFQAPNNSALMGAAPRERQGVAAGVMGTGRVLGQSLGVAFAGALFGIFGGTDAAKALHHGAVSSDASGAFLDGMHAAFAGGAVLAVASALMALVRGREGRA